MSTFGPLKSMKCCHPKHYTIIISRSNIILKKGFLSEEKLKTVKYIYIQNQEGSHVIFIGLHRNVGTYFMI